MSIPILEVCQKRKRRPKLYGFHTFGDPGCPIHSKGAFCNNIRVFLQECGQLHDVVVKGMPAWCTLLVHDTRKFLVPLYTIEENVVCSPKPYCDHCRYAEFPITGRSSSECLAATVECDICEVCVAAHSLLWHWGH